MTAKAVEVLCATGLLTPETNENGSLNLFTEYKKDSIRLRTTEWTTVSQHFFIYSDETFGLDPLEANIVVVPESAVASPQIVDSLGDTISSGLRFPRLPALFRGLSRKYLNTGDDMAMIAIEQLVDGMDLDQEWCDRHLSSAETAVLELAAKLVRHKTSRLDDFNGNEVTCFVATREEAERLRGIIGYD